MKPDPSEAYSWSYLEGEEQGGGHKPGYEQCK